MEQTKAVAYIPAECTYGRAVSFEGLLHNGLLLVKILHAQLLEIGDERSGIVGGTQRVHSDGAEVEGESRVVLILFHRVEKR